MLSRLSKQAAANEETELSADFLKHAQELEEAAIGVLSEGYQRDRLLTHDLLVQVLKRWGDTTVMNIADSAEKMNFMGHAASQNKLNNIWNGNMASYTSPWAIVFGLFFPPVVLFMRFTVSDTVPLRPVEKQYQEKVDDDLQAKHFSSSTCLNEKEQKTVLKPKHVTLCRCPTGEDTIPFCKALYYFYTAPVVKFCYHTISQVLFLGVFSFFVLTDLRPSTEPNSPSIEEYLIWAWTATLLIEEVRQVMTPEPFKTHWLKLRFYFSSDWNRFDVVVYLLFILSIILRYTLSDERFVIARGCYSVSLALFYIRFMQVFFVEKNIGPKVVMIRGMFTDLRFFFFIIIVAIFAYGVALQALRFPNHPASWVLLKDIVYLPYWQMLGYLFLDDLEGDVGECTNDTSLWKNWSANKCPETSWMIMIMLALYLILTNILMISILTAMFSNTIKRVESNSEHLWRFYRYELINEYYDRPTLAPPIIIINHIYRAIRYCYRWCHNIKVDDTAFKINFSIGKEVQLRVFERARMEDYLLHQLIMSKNNLDAKVVAAGNRIEQVVDEMERMKQYIRGDSDYADQKWTFSPGYPASDELDAAKFQSEEDSQVLHESMVKLEGQIQQQKTQLDFQNDQLAQQKKQLVRQERHLVQQRDQLIHQANQLSQQQSMMEEMVDLLKGVASQGGIQGASPYSRAPQPHIEIQDLWVEKSTL